MRDTGWPTRRGPASPPCASIATMRDAWLQGVMSDHPETYLDAETGRLWVWDGRAWVDTGPWLGSPDPATERTYGVDDE
jgi:hypothetical protein